MKKNNSPWLHQLKRTREFTPLHENIQTDILIVGGGISGVMTAYQILKQTSLKVVVVDAHLVGHGATGHNAGQLTTYFERPLADIATQFGVELACQAQKDVESAWEILANIERDIELKTPIYTFTGYAGLTTLSQIILHLADNMVRHNGDIPIEKMLIAEDFEHLTDIPTVFSHLFEVTTRANILNVLETNNSEYIAVLAYKKGATNSALICEEVVEYMTKTYPSRFQIYEHTPIQTIILEKDTVYTQTSAQAPLIIQSHKVILCTNGFEGFTIVNHHGTDINTKFHQKIRGSINFMSAYLDTTKETPTAISYFPPASLGKHDPLTGEPYFYITRRPHIHNGVEMGLISTGGPERLLEEDVIYSRYDNCEDWAEKDISQFLEKNYAKYSDKNIIHDFCWHGLLGYTNTGLRLIGKEPLNPLLLYNLGCNGVGIMPSIFGSVRIAEILNNKNLGPSIFDPHLNTQ